LGFWCKICTLLTVSPSKPTDRADRNGLTRRWTCPLPRPQPSAAWNFRHIDRRRLLRVRCAANTRQTAVDCSPSAAQRTPGRPRQAAERSPSSEHPTTRGRLGASRQPDSVCSPIGALSGIMTNDVRQMPVIMGGAA
jgi:hypothetical protein